MTEIIITMSQRDALLLTPEQHPDGHLGLWYYAKELYPDLKVGDEIVFHANGEVYARGRVTGFLPPSARKYCSRLNDAVFTWEPNE